MFRRMLQGPLAPGVLDPVGLLPGFRHLATRSDPAPTAGPTKPAPGGWGQAKHPKTPGWPSHHHEVCLTRYGCLWKPLEIFGPLGSKTERMPHRNLTGSPFFAGRCWESLFEAIHVPRLSLFFGGVFCVTPQNGILRKPTFRGPGPASGQRAERHGGGLSEGRGPGDLHAGAEHLRGPGEGVFALYTRGFWLGIPWPF